MHLERGQVIRVGFSRDLEYRRGNLVLDGWFAKEPFGIGPTLEDGSGRLDALLMECLDVVKGIEYEQRVLQLFRRQQPHIRILQESD
jgi:hypothetical protein